MIIPSQDYDNLYLIPNTTTVFFPFRSMEKDPDNRVPGIPALHPEKPKTILFFKRLKKGSVIGKQGDASTGSPDPFCQT